MTASLMPIVNMGRIQVRAAPGTFSSTLMKHIPEPIIELVVEKLKDTTGFYFSHRDVVWDNNSLTSFTILAYDAPHNSSCTSQIMIDDTISVNIVHALCGHLVITPDGFSSIELELSAAPAEITSFAHTSCLYIKDVDVIMYMTKNDIYSIVSRHLGEPLHSMTYFLNQQKPRLRITAYSDALSKPENVIRIKEWLRWVVDDSDEDDESSDGSEESGSGSCGSSYSYSCLQEESAESGSDGGIDGDELEAECLCKVCYTNALGALCIPCGHLYMCMSCVKEQCNRGMMSCCGVCRGEVKDIVQAKLFS